MIDELADESEDHIETIVGSPLYRGAADIEQLHEARERIVRARHSSNLCSIRDDQEQVPREVMPEAHPARSDAPSSYEYDGAEKPKSGYELWKERQDRLKNERDPEIQRQILAEVGTILHQRAAIRTQGLPDPFVRSREKDLQTGPQVRHPL